MVGICWVKQLNFVVLSQQNCEILQAGLPVSVFFFYVKSSIKGKDGFLRGMNLSFGNPEDSHGGTEAGFLQPVQASLPLKSTEFSFLSPFSFSLYLLVTLLFD
jgi:hypothetical protein